MKSRFSRDARNKAIPGARRTDHSTFHHGDEFDEILPEHHSLSVRPVRDYTPKVEQKWEDDCSPETRPDLANQLGPLIEGAEPVVTVNGDFDSFRAAFDKRSNSQPAKDDDCSPEFMSAALSLWQEVDRHARALNLFDSFDVDDVIIDRWLSKFDDAKRSRMIRAMDRLPELFRGTEYDGEELGRKDLFVKVEALLKRYDNKWAPRLIYQGTDEFNALTGPVAMVICERLVELFDTVAIGPLKVKMAYKVNDVTLAEFIRDSTEFGHDECFEADFSANDLNQRHGANTVFQAVCRILGVPDWFTTLLERMSSFTVYNREFGLRAQLDNQLPTGTTVTTPRNSVWNATIEAVFAQLNKNSGVCLILGDDFLGMFKKKVSKEIEAWVSEHPKMKLTAAWPSLSGQSTFLSRRICTYTDSWCMMPKLGKALARFNARASSNQAISDSAYMAGKALSYAYEFRHFPIFCDLFLRRYTMEEDRAKVSVEEVSWFTRTSGIDLNDLAALIKREKVIADEDQTREFLMDAYGDEFGLVDALAIAERVILSRDLVSVTGPSQLEIDY